MFLRQNLHQSWSAVLGGGCEGGVPHPSDPSGDLVLYRGWSKTDDTRAENRAFSTVWAQKNPRFGQNAGTLRHGFVNTPLNPPSQEKNPEKILSSRRRPRAASCRDQNVGVPDERRRFGADSPPRTVNAFPETPCLQKSRSTAKSTRSSSTRRRGVSGKSPSASRAIAP